MKHYLLICEIGPIYDFVRHSRKTKDYWAASFLFSYFMAEVAKSIKSNGGDIFIPYLDNNPMVSGSGDITCGSVPDQIYAVITENNKDTIKEKLKEVIGTTINTIAIKVKSAADGKGNFTADMDYDEIKRFLNFFFIVHPIGGGKPTYKEFIEAERKIKMRAALIPFELSRVAAIPKWEKCNLCGDRKRVFEKKIDKGTELLAVERICSVCLLKRYLPEAAKNINKRIIAPTGEDRYESTSDIALRPIKELIETADAEIKNEYNVLIDICKKESENIDLSEGRYFYDSGFRDRFTGWEKKVLKKYPEEQKLKWFNHPFYAIVYMDGDNIGDVLKNKDDNFEPYIKKISELLSNFSNSVNAIVSEHNHGQLIFAGGEDINFIIHPEYLLDCIEELNNLYNHYFAEYELTKPMADKFTLSAGVIVCYHKYPLSRAILRAGEILKDKAKKYPDKNATAISLIKGHTETFNFTFSNELIGDLKKLKECLLTSSISRTTPYRIRESEDILKSISDNTYKENYLYTIIAGTRRVKKTDDEIAKMARLLMKFGKIDIETMINVLLYARFLAGDK